MGHIVYHYSFYVSSVTSLLFRRMDNDVTPPTPPKILSSIQSLHRRGPSRKMETDIPPIFIFVWGIAIFVVIQFVFACLIFGVLTVPPIFIFLIGIAIQIVFACFIYAVFMAWNFLFVDPVDDSLALVVTEEIKKSDLEKGQAQSQRVIICNKGKVHGRKL